jgi:hypothetical protein
LHDGGVSGGGVDDVRRAGCVDEVVGSAPDDEEGFVGDGGVGGEIVGDLLTHVVYGEGESVAGAVGEDGGADVGGAEGVGIVGASGEGVDDGGMSGEHGCELDGPDAGVVACRGNGVGAVGEAAVGVVGGGAGDLRAGAVLGFAEGGVITGIGERVPEDHDGGVRLTVSEHSRK